MNRNFGIGILILCFGTCSVNAGLAAQVVEIQPIIVQPYDLSDLREISQQMLEQDRINRDQELAMRGLIDDNQKFTGTALARQQDATLEKINQTMINYRDSLLSRGWARIMVNSRRVSPYYDLIKLTEDVDDMKSAGQALLPKRDVIEEKYKILTDLKDEMMALNEKLSEAAAKGEMIKSQKNQAAIPPIVVNAPGNAVLPPIIVNAALFKDQGAAYADELKAKDESIRWLNQVLAIVKNKAEYYQLTSQIDRVSTGQVREEGQDLKARLQDKEDQADQLKQQLDGKTAQSDQMTVMMGDYQKKLEAKNNAYNEQLRQVLLLRSYQEQMEAQIADLNARLQEKEAQIVNIKKEMYDLQEAADIKDRDLQAKDLSLSMVLQKKMDRKNNEITSLKTDLALARQELAGMPGSDEIDFLRTGLKKVSLQLKQKDEMFVSAKANADEYEKEFNKQTKEFKSLKEQLQNAYVEINHRNEDLKYKDMEIIRLKERSAVTEGDLQDQIKALTSHPLSNDR